MWLYVSLPFPLLFLLVALVLGIITPDYNAIKEPISTLVITSNGVFQLLNFFVCGFFIFLLGLSVQRVRKTSTIKAIVSRVIMFFGGVMILLTIFPTDKTIIPTTFHGFVHLFLFIAILLAFLFSELIAGVKIRKTNVLFAYYCFASFGISAMSSVFMLLFQNYLGIFQRILVLTIVVWFMVSPVVVKYKNS